ncbi:MAG: hypothetical protein QOE05_2944 [Actinomycetota bacterium]|jgi:hypothetical protein|nr:hypothetical protein [Actinomycetota bacterium]
MSPDGPPTPPYRPLPVAVVRIPDELPTTSAAFTEDVRAALGVWRKHPALPLATTFFAAVTAAASSSWSGAGVAGLVAVVFLGWVGSERLWYLRAYTGRTLALRAALRASPTYWGRFVALAFWVGVLTSPLYIPALVYGGAFDEESRGTQAHLGTWALVYLAVGSLVTDFLLTFVTPAIVFNTRRARSAMKIGLRLLRLTWPHAALYVLFPPLAVLLLTRFSQGPVGWSGAALIVISTLVNLLAKGAVTSYYLRLMPVTEPDGDID